MDGIKEELTKSGNVFRGCSDSSYKLIPTAGRLPHPSIELEKELLRQFSAHIEPTIDGTLSSWDCLIAAQHYGVPTRLLDWTINPLIALYFAARRDKSVDFSVYSAGVTILKVLPADSPFMIEQPTFVEPTLFDTRIQNQESVFSIHGDPSRSLRLSKLSHFTFPASLRTDALALCAKNGVSEDHLFPVGLTTGWKTTLGSQGTTA